MRGSGARLLAAACIAALTACGETSAPGTGTDREWVANAGVVIDQLERDVLLAANGGTTMHAAREALQRQSNLYTILVAYTDFGGCSHMVSSVGPPAARFARVERSLAEACTVLKRAAALFTQAVTNHDARALFTATRTTFRASPLLVHAKAELDRLGGRI